MTAPLARPTVHSSPAAPRKVSGLRPVVVLLALAALTVAVAVATREVHDDPWILYRYAENLAAGRGWTFNPGIVEANAVTSPLTVLLLAALLTVGVPVAVGSAALFAAGTWLAAASTYAVLRHAGRPVAGVAAAVLVVTAPPLVSLRGMETALYLGLTAAGLLLAVYARHAALGVVLGLAVLARPDAALLAVVVTCWVGWRARRIPWAVLSAAAVLVPWLAVSVWLTGSVLPSTLAAKAAQAASGVWQGYLAGLFWSPLQPGMRWWFALALPLGAAGALFAWRRSVGVVVPLVVVAAAQVLAYGVVLRIASYAWYVALPVFLLCWLAGLGVDSVAATGRRSTSAVAVAALGVAVAVATVQVPTMAPFRGQYEDVAAWLRTETPPGSSVAAAEIGRLAYLSDRRMVDYLGLLDAAAADHVSRRDWDWWVAELHPDYWVTFAPGSPQDFVVESSVRSSPDVAATYEPVYATQDLVVYGRRHSPGVR